MYHAIAYLKSELLFKEIPLIADIYWLWTSNLLNLCVIIFNTFLEGLHLYESLTGNLCFKLGFLILIFWGFLCLENHIYTDLCFYIRSYTYAIYRFIVR